MMYSEMVEGKKFTRKSGVQSAFLFLFNYVLLLLVITFFIFLNSLKKPMKLSACFSREFKKIKKVISARSAKSPIGRA